MKSGRWYRNSSSGSRGFSARSFKSAAICAASSALVALSLALGGFSAEKETIRLRVMTYNLHSCKGTDGRVSPERIAQVVQQYRPDVLALQEVRVGREAPFTNQPRVIADATGMHSIFYPLVKMAHDDFGIAILSKYPLQLVQSENLPTLPRRRPLERRGAIWVQVDVNGSTVQVVGTHLGLNADEKLAQVAALLGTDWMQNQKMTEPFVLLGDFNSRPQQKSYQLLAQTFTDAVKAVMHDSAPATWHSTFPVVRIDHVFIPRSAHARAVQVPRTDLTRVASDHLPLIVDLEFDASRAQS